LTVSDDPRFQSNNPDLKEFENVNLINGESGGGSSNPYETDSSVNLYCEFHFGERLNFFGIEVPMFPVTIAMVAEQVAF
jgi:hypothetical protein